jgi:ATP-dependent helicase/DNAse subunit B
VPLKLVTGPANAAKAGVVLGDYRARLEEDPVLVVPALRDVEHSQRELAEYGAVFGGKVMRFRWLFETIAQRCGLPRGRRASPVQRELVMDAAVRSLDLRELRDSARRAGFARAAVRFVSDLERSAVEPDRFEEALAAWAGRGPRRRYAQEIASVYSAYRDALEAAGLTDDDLFAWRAVDALREEAWRWGTTPVFFYGFDSFTPLELDAIEALATRSEAAVTVSLPYERGRAAFRAVAPFFERLATMATDHVELDAIDEHYAPEARAALHHLERSLYEEPAARPDAGDAVRLHAAGGERAEVELVGAEVLRLLRGGTDPGEVAVVFREPGRYASVVEQVFDAYGIPFSIDRRVPLAHTALGRGLLALLRCSTREGSADDLLAYLRTPGKVREPAIVDILEAEARRKGAQTAVAARRLWEQRDRRRLDEVDRLRGAASERELLVQLDSELERLFSAPYRRLAKLFGLGEMDDPRVFREARRALADLHSLASDAELDRDRVQRVHDTLAALPVRLGEDPRPDRVQVASPTEIRARRFEAVFVCGLQEGELPRPQGANPFLSEEDRRAIFEASGLRLHVRDDQLDRERYLFYVCASRAERVLRLSSRFADEEGNPRVESFFVEDVRDLFGEIETLRRSLSDVTWPPEEAPTRAEWERGAALAGPAAEPERPDGLHARPVLADLEARTCLSAGALESYADCPVKWLVEKLIDPKPLEPDPEPMVRGRYAHAVLEATHRRLGERVSPENVERAETILLEELKAGEREFQISPKETRVRTAVRKLEFDLLRLLRREAASGSRLEPRELELAFGMDEEGSRPPLELTEEGISIRGRIDRVDALNGHALVRDYKSGRSAYPVAKWEEDNRLQVALYMLAVRELLGLEPVGGVYVPLADPKGKPRGLVSREHAAELGEGFVDKDLKERAEFDDQLVAARARVGELAARMRAGEVRPCPESCAWNGGCSYPSICREEG